MSRPAGGDGAGAWARARISDLPASERHLQDLGRLLARAHGCLVRGPRGEPLGRIAGLAYGLDDRWPRALLLRRHGLRGLLSPTTWEVPLSAVTTVVLERREVRVGRGGALREDASQQAVREVAAPALDLARRPRRTGARARSAALSGAESPPSVRR